MIIPYISAIGILGSITLYQIYLNTLFKGTYKDKLYYFNSHLTTLITIVSYTFMLLDEVLITTPSTTKYFYIEWAFTTPLTLINLGRLTNISLNKYIYIILLDQLMILCGYISYITTNEILSYTTFGVGCVCYSIINAIYVKNLKIFNKEQEKPRIKQRIFAVLYFTIAFSWIVYPITHILLKTNNITTNTSVIIYAILDVFTKGVFTTLMIGSKEIYQPHKSWIKSLSHKVFRIHPLEIDPNQNRLDEINDTMKVAEKYNLRVIKVDTVEDNTIDITTQSHVSYIVKVIRSEDIERVTKEDIKTESSFRTTNSKSRRMTHISTLESVNEEGNDSPPSEKN